MPAATLPSTWLNTEVEAKTISLGNVDNANSITLVGGKGAGAGELNFTINKALSLLNDGSGAGLSIDTSGAILFNQNVNTFGRDISLGQNSPSSSITLADGVDLSTLPAAGVGGNFTASTGNFNNAGTGRVITDAGKITLTVGAGTDVLSSDSTLGTLTTSHAEGISVTGASDADTITLAADAVFTSDAQVKETTGNITFTAVENLSSVNSTLTDSTGNDLALGKNTSDKLTVAVNGTAFHGLNSATGTHVDGNKITGGSFANWEADGTSGKVTGKYSSDSIIFDGINAVAGGNKLTATTTGLAFSLEKGAADTDINIALADIDFSAISTVDSNQGIVTISTDATKALTDATVDLGVTDGAAESQKMTVTRQSGGTGTSFSGVAIVNNTRRLKLAKNSNTVTVFASDAADTEFGNDIKFNGITELDAGAGTDVLTGTSGTEWNLTEAGGVKAGTAGTVTFSGFETVDAAESAPGVAGTATIKGSDAAETFAIKDTGSVAVAGATFNQVTSIDAGDAAGADAADGSDADSVVFDLDGGSTVVKTWQLQGSEKISAAGVVFDQVEQAGSAGDKATVTAAGNGTWTLQSVLGDHDSEGATPDTYKKIDGSVASSGITFSGIKTVDQAGAVVVTGSDAVDAITIKGSGSLDANTIGFTNVTNANLDSTDTVTDSVAELKYTELATVENATDTTVSSFSAAGIGFTGVSLANVGWSAGDSIQLAATHHFGGLSINAKQATLVGSAGSDTFTISADDATSATIDYQMGSTGTAVNFTGVIDVDAGAGDADTVINQVGTEWQLQADADSTDALVKSVKTGSVTFGAVEVAKQQTSDTTPVAKDGSIKASDDKDTVSITGTEALTANGIKFINITEATSLSASDVISDSGSQFYELHKDRVDVSGIRFAGVDKSAFVWGADDFLGLAKNHGLTNIEADAIDAKTATLKGSEGSDGFSLNAANVRYKRGDSTGQVYFKNLTKIDGNNPVSGSDSDSVVGINNATDWSLNADHSLGHGTYTISNIENASGGSGVLNASAATNTQFSLVDNTGTGLSNNQVRIVDTNTTPKSDITFSGITKLTAGDATADEVEGAASENWTLKDLDGNGTATDINANAIDFTGITVATIHEDAGNTATVTGSALDDNFELSSTIGQERWVTVNGLTFKQVNKVDGAGDVTNGDKITGVKDQHWFIANASGDFKTASDATAITFSNIERAEASGNIQLTTRSGGTPNKDTLLVGGGAVSLDIDGDTSGASDRVAFVGVKTANIKNQDVIEDDGDNDYTLYSDTKAQVDGINFVGQSKLNLNFWSAGDTLSLDSAFDFNSDSIDANQASLIASAGSDTFVIKAGSIDYKVGSLDAKTANFTNLGAIDGNNNIDTVNLTDTATDTVIADGVEWKLDDSAD